MSARQARERVRTDSMRAAKAIAASVRRNLAMDAEVNREDDHHVIVVPEIEFTIEEASEVMDDVRSRATYNSLIVISIRTLRGNWIAISKGWKGVELSAANAADRAVEVAERYQKVISDDPLQGYYDAFDAAAYKLRR